MKKLLFVLLAAATVFTGCQKDSGTTVNIGTADLTAVNNQLKGKWLYPIATNKIVETASKAVDSVFNGPGPALQFDGFTHVNIIQDSETTLKGTYSLTTKNGLIYLDITYPDGNDVSYQVLLANGETLKLESSAPYTGMAQGTNAIDRALVSDITLKKQTGSDAAGYLVRVLVKSDKAYYSVSVSVTHTALKAPADTAVLLNTKLNTLGSYLYEFQGKYGDQLLVDVLGDYTQTNFYAYLNGVPMAGNVGYDFQEIKTTTGWMVQ